MAMIISTKARLCYILFASSSLQKSLNLFMISLAFCSAAFLPPLLSYSYPPSRALFFRVFFLFPFPVGFCLSLSLFHSKSFSFSLFPLALFVTQSLSLLNFSLTILLLTFSVQRHAHTAHSLTHTYTQETLPLLLVFLTLDSRFSFMHASCFCCCLLLFSQMLNFLSCLTLPQILCCSVFPYIVNFFSVLLPKPSPLFAHLLLCAFT